ncbi:hypothetical protein Rs2_14127 [Raphanus sativus]|nr:hypothetical protein Rs2_14127 [Raphanus sativus]
MLSGQRSGGDDDVCMVYACHRCSRARSCIVMQRLSPEFGFPMQSYISNTVVGSEFVGKNGGDGDSPVWFSCVAEERRSFAFFGVWSPIWWKGDTCLKRWPI